MVVSRSSFLAMNDPLSVSVYYRLQRYALIVSASRITMEVNLGIQRGDDERNPEQAERVTETDKIRIELFKEPSNKESNHEITEKTSHQVPDAGEVDMDEIREVFNLFDKDGNGCITASELRHLLKSLGYNMTEAELMDMMNKIDADGNGAIDFPEFLELTTKKLHVSSDADLARQTFQIFDRSLKGHITADDLRHIFRILEQKFSEEELQDMIYQADFDRDGVVGLDDFLKMMNLSS